MAEMTPRWIKLLRRSRKQSQEDFGRDVGVRARTISLWENGRFHPMRVFQETLREMSKLGR